MAISLHQRQHRERDTEGPTVNFEHLSLRFMRKRRRRDVYDIKQVDEQPLFYFKYKMNKLEK